MPDIANITTPTKANETDDTKSETEKQKKQITWRRRQMWLATALAYQGRKVN